MASQVLTSSHPINQVLPANPSLKLAANSSNSQTQRCRAQLPQERVLQFRRHPSGVYSSITVSNNVAAVRTDSANSANSSGVPLLHPPYASHAAAPLDLHQHHHHVNSAGAPGGGDASLAGVEEVMAGRKKNLKASLQIYQPQTPISLNNGVELTGIDEKESSFLQQQKQQQQQMQQQRAKLKSGKLPDCGGMNDLFDKSLSMTNTPSNVVKILNTPVATGAISNLPEEEDVSATADLMPDNRVGSEKHGQSETPHGFDATDVPPDYAPMNKQQRASAVKSGCADDKTSRNETALSQTGKPPSSLPPQQRYMTRSVVNPSSNNPIYDNRRTKSHTQLNLNRISKYKSGKPSTKSANQEGQTGADRILSTDALFSQNDPPPGFGIEMKCFYVYQKRPKPLEPLRVWKGFNGNVYYEPLKISESSMQKKSVVPQNANETACVNMHECSQPLQKIIHRSRWNPEYTIDRIQKNQDRAVQREQKKFIREMMIKRRVAKLRRNLPMNSSLGLFPTNLQLDLPYLQEKFSSLNLTDDTNLQVANEIARREPWRGQTPNTQRYLKGFCTTGTIRMGGGAPLTTTDEPDQQLLTSTQNELEHIETMNAHQSELSMQQQQQPDAQPSQMKIAQEN